MDSCKARITVCLLFFSYTQPPAHKTKLNGLNYLTFVEINCKEHQKMTWSHKHMRGKAKPQEFATHFEIDSPSLDKTSPKHRLCAASCDAGGTVPFLTHISPVPPWNPSQNWDFSISRHAYLFFLPLLVIIGLSYLPTAIHAVVGGVSKYSLSPFQHLSITLVITQELIRHLNRLGLFIL